MLLKKELPFKSQRQTDAQKFFALGVRLEIRAMDFEGQLLLQQHLSINQVDIPL